MAKLIITHSGKRIELLMGRRSLPQKLVDAINANSKPPNQSLPGSAEFNNLAGFPATGQTGIIYIATDTESLYRWDGSAYVNIGNRYITSDGASNILFAVTDAAGNKTDLTLNADGQLDNEIVESLKTRMGVKDEAVTNNTAKNSDMPSIASVQTNILASDKYMKSGECLPVLPDMTKVIALGSSSMARSKTAWEAKLATVTNHTITPYTPALSGAIVEQSVAQYMAGGMTAVFNNNTINASGISQFTTSLGWNVTINMQGWFGGVLGTVNFVNGSGTFTRTTAGNAVTVSEAVPFIPKTSSEYRNGVLVLWSGKNNLTNADSTINNVDAVVANIDKMIEYQASLIKRVIVLGHFVNTGTPANSPERDRILQCNAIHKRRYGDNYIDVQELITSDAIFTALNITKTAQDTAEIALNNMPSSLTGDNQHLTPAAYAYVMDAVMARMIQKGWYTV